MLTRVSGAVSIQVHRGRDSTGLMRCDSTDEPFQILLSASHQTAARAPNVVEGGSGRVEDCGGYYSDMSGMKLSGDEECDVRSRMR